MMGRKSETKKRRQAIRQLRGRLLKGAYIEGISTADGMIRPAISFDLENIADAEALLIDAGYSGRQANIAIVNNLRDIKGKAEAVMMSVE